MAMQKKAWTTFFLFKKFLTFFKNFILGGVFLTHWYLLVLGGHGSHVTLKKKNMHKNLG
jgi:hypothetical protein